MKCPKCNNELNKGDKFCPNCGEKITEVVNAEKVNTTEEKRIIAAMSNDVFFCILSLILVFCGPTIGTAIATVPGLNALSPILDLLPLAGLGLCIFALVKYPKSVFAKVLLIVYMVLFVLAIIVIVLMLLTCINVLQDCSGMGTIISNLWLLIR